jgi:Sigma-70 region 2
VDDPLERFAGVSDQYYRNVPQYLLQHAEQGTAEDVASETFLIAWRRFPAISDPPLPWLLGVARNLLRKQARAGLRRRELVARLAQLSSAADGSVLDAGDFVVERTPGSRGAAAGAGRGRRWGGRGGRRRGGIAWRQGSADPRRSAGGLADPHGVGGGAVRIGPQRPRRPVGQRHRAGALAGRVRHLLVRQRARLRARDSGIPWR